MLLLIVVKITLTIAEKSLSLYRECKLYALPIMYSYLLETLNRGTVAAP